MNRKTSSNIAQKWCGRIVAGAALMLAASSAQAIIIYDQWTTNAGISGNYTIEITEDNDNLEFFATVDPWNAELLGLFIDLGDFDFNSTPTINSVSTSPVANGSVALFSTDTTDSNGPTDCGAGCNLNEGGIGITLPPDGEWELVFSLGGAGFEGIQTFSWTLDAEQALSESMLGLVGVRSQVLCSGGDLLPTNEGSCGGSDMSMGSPNPTPPPVAVPEPTSLALMGIGLVGFTVAMRRRRSLNV